MASQTGTDKWRALECNPEVLDGFLNKVGVDGLAFQDIYSLDDEMLAFLPQPTAAIIFIFPGGEHEDQSSAPPLPPGSPFFLYQIAGLGNACGTIAAIHAVANSGAAASLAEGTTLKTFLDENAAASPQERGAALLASEVIRKAHDEMASAGQSSDEGADGKSENHFICLVHSGGHLYELDGLKAAPINRGPSSPETLLKDAAKVIQEVHIAKSPDGGFAMMALGPKGESD